MSLKIMIKIKEKTKTAIFSKREAGKVVAKTASVLLSPGKNLLPFFVSGSYLGPSYLNKKFRPGIDKIYYSMAVYGDEEKKAVAETLDKGWLGMGNYTAEFSKKIAAVFGKKSGVLVNSGSSGTLLALKILNLPVGSEVITTACTFATTFAAILNNGLIPVVADSELDSYNLDLKNLDKMVSSKSRAVIVSHTLGNLNDMKVLQKFCRKNKLYLIEDSCDTIGGKIYNRPTGSFADITVGSFYASHHITAAGGGGILCTDNDKLLAKALAYRDWGRFGDDNEDVNERFNLHIDGIPYDRKFIYSTVGFNLKPIEIQAAFGLVQLGKLTKFNQIRKRNVAKLISFFKKYEDIFILPKELPQAEVSWLALPLTIRDDALFSRLELLSHLELNKIQTRLLFSGNILRQPAFKNSPRRIVGSLVNADKIMKDTFVIGCHHGLTDEMISYVCKVFEDFLKSHSR